MKKALLLCSLAILVVFVLSCGHPMTLESITVAPSTATVCPISATAPVQYTAYGTFIHPSQTVDITTEVTWTSSIPAVGIVGLHTGVVTSADQYYGVTNITATAGKGIIGPGNADEIVVGQSTFTVQTPNSSGVCQ
jgi:hypothetical protein